MIMSLCHAQNSLLSQPPHFWTEKAMSSIKYGDKEELGSWTNFAKEIIFGWPGPFSAKTCFKDTWQM